MALKSVRATPSANNKTLETVNIVTSGDHTFETYNLQTTDDRRWPTVQDSGGLIKGLRTIIVPGYNPGGAYAAHGVHFDGNTSVVQTSSGIADANKISIIQWVRVPSSSLTGASWSFFATLPPSGLAGRRSDMVDVAPNFNSDLGAFFQNGDGVSDANVATLDGALPADTWCSVAVNFDGTQAVPPVNIFVNGVNVNDNSTYGNDGAQFAVQILGGTIALPRLFGTVPPIQPFDMSDSQVWFGKVINFGNPADYANFASGGSPVNPTVAAAAYGAQTLLFSGDKDTFPVNQGTGGTFSVTGTLTNASTHP